MSFERQLAFGAIGENRIVQWLVARGAIVLPVYEIETEQHLKGPRAFSDDCEYRAPDILALTGRHGPTFVEAKRKTCFSWHRKSQFWQTGIDLACYRDYLGLRKNSNLPVWLLFLHGNERPDPRDLRYGCPPQCPTGLFGQELLVLSQCVHHSDQPSRKNNSRSGMVYWTADSLLRIANIDGTGCIEPGRGMP